MSKLKTKCNNMDLYFEIISLSVHVGYCSGRELSINVAWPGHRFLRALYPLAGIVYFSDSALQEVVGGQDRRALV